MGGVMLKFTTFAISCLLFYRLPVTPLPAASVTININATNPGPRLNPGMYGIFLEEINHGVDGGLYAEMIRNRGFEDAKPPEGFTFRPGNGDQPRAAGWPDNTTSSPSPAPCAWIISIRTAR